MTEDEYVEYLEDERRHFAWVMQHHGDMTPAEAGAAALKRYPYEPSEAPYRGLIFHDEAWHWAMLQIHGELYWTKHPELLNPPHEYTALS
ncbi:hypothetical protein ACFORO_08845 [Amycolatopsis halotolerans]|uniref:Uncharacterized protein n=1 Tax=Amycolatopsis halotolerans TaxID=330083 RepID=A0ABV7QAU4_9PSEU